MAGEGAKLDISKLSTRGDQKFKDQMKAELYGREKAEHPGEPKEVIEEWKELLHTIGESIKRDRTFRARLKKQMENPESEGLETMSPELRNRILELIEIAESFEEAPKSTETEWKNLAAQVGVGLPTETLPVEPWWETDTGEPTLDVRFSNDKDDKELEKYAASFMKKSNWREEVFKAMGDTENIMNALKFFEIQKNPRLNIASELREFLNNCFQMTEEFTISIAKLTQKLFPEGLPEGFTVFAQKIREQPDWQNSIAGEMKKSPEFRVKVAFLTGVAKKTETLKIPRDLRDYLINAMKPYKGTIAEDMLTLAGFDIGKWEKILGPQVAEFMKPEMITSLPPERRAEQSLPIDKPDQPVTSTAGGHPAILPVKAAEAPSAGRDATKNIGGKFALPDVKNMGLQDLFRKLVELGMNLKTQLGGLFGGKEALSEKPKVAKFTDRDFERMSPPGRKIEKSYTPDQSARFVTNFLRLPPVATVPDLLEALIDESHGRVLITGLDRMKEIGMGDVLFFQRKGEKAPYLTAVVSSVEPLKMRTVPASGGTDVEMEVRESDDFKNNWLGFIKLPKKQSNS